MRHIIPALLVLLSLPVRLAAQPKVEFDQTIRDMGTLIWQQPRAAVFQLTNKSTETLYIKDVETDCGCTLPEWTDKAIEPGAKATVSATYDAALLGHFTKNLFVHTNLSDTPYRLQISGEVAMKEKTPAGAGYPYKIGSYALSTDEIEFDDVHKGDTPEATLYVYNGSKKSYRPALMHTPKYLTATAEPEIVRPGSTGRVTLRLNSHALNSLGLTQTSVYLSRFEGDRVSRENEIGVSVVLLPEVAETPTADSPRLVMENDTVTVTPSGRKGAAGQILLKNDGARPLVISMLQVYHPGISVSLSKREIAQGETAKLKIKLNDAAVKKGKNRKILLLTNDPRQSKTTIAVRIAE